MKDYWTEFIIPSSDLYMKQLQLFMMWAPISRSQWPKLIERYWWQNNSRWGASRHVGSSHDTELGMKLVQSMCGVTRQGRPVAGKQMWEWCKGNNSRVVWETSKRTTQSPRPLVWRLYALGCIPLTHYYPILCTTILPLKSTTPQRPASLSRIQTSYHHNDWRAHSSVQCWIRRVLYSTTGNEAAT